jgi:biotin carboxyl carrier protein
VKQHLTVSVGQLTYQIDITEEDGMTRVVLDGVQVDAELFPADPSGLIRLRVGKRILPLLAARSESGWTLALEGSTVDVSVVDERSARLASFGGARSRAAHHATITAPMPGLVVQVNAEPGQEVSAGQSLVVLQAMKMENELASPAAGTVKAVLVQPGQAVNQGQLLLELE